MVSHPQPVARRLAPVPIVALVAGLFFAIRAPAEPPRDREQGEYQFLAVAAPKCADAGLKKLTNPVRSARKIAAAFRKLHYEVSVLEEDNATAARVMKWVKERAGNKRTKLAVMALVGHGCRRGGDDWFLTRDATRARGGVSMKEIDQLGERGNISLVTVIDSCREEVAPAPRAVAAKPAARGAGPGPIHRLMRGDADLDAMTGTSAHRTRLYSARPGEVVPDEKDLVEALAEALEVDPRFKRFRGDPWFQVPGHRSEAGAPLTLRDWFFYGITRHMERQGLRRSAQLVPGSPALTTPIARAHPLGLPVAPPPFIGRAAGGLNLLPRWKPQHGGYDDEPAHDEAAWLISVPADGARGEPWKGGFLHQSGEGFPVQDRGRPQALFAEVVANFGLFDGFAPEAVRVGLDAKFVGRTRDEWVSHDRQKRLFVVRTGIPTWCKIDLLQKKGTLVNYFGISDIPSSCVVTIRQLWLAPAGVRVPAGVDREVDLLSRWWTGNQGRLGPGALGFSFLPAGDRRILHVQAGKGWVGGALGPPLWVVGGQEVELLVENRDSVKGRFLFEVKEGYGQLGARNLTVKPGMNTLRLRLDGNGLANFLAVSSPTRSIYIHAIVLKPGPVNLAQKRR
jgi:Caspase domain